MKKYSLLLIILFSCVEDYHHDTIDITIINPDISNKTEITFKELFNLHSNEIGRDTIVTGYVVSSDAEGNFFKEIFVQNTLDVTDLGTDNPRMGIRIRIGLTTTSTKYTKGRRIAINLEGLKKTTSDNLLTLGKPNGNFIKDISEFELDDYIYKFDEVGKVVAKELMLSELNTQDLNTLVNIRDLHFKASQIGMSYAGLSTDNFDGKRALEFCNTKRQDTILLETSNFADFADQIIPNSQIDISAIYNISFDDEPILILNTITDLQEMGIYTECSEIVTEDLMITEVADPKVASGEVARYVEIYNPTNEEISLDGWKLVRYNHTTSKNTKDLAAIPISLDGLTIAVKGFVIVANHDIDDITEISRFETYFGFTPNLTDTDLSGNGDDAYELIDPLNKIKDVYGNPTADGTDSLWEYEDGVAVRDITLNSPNTFFTTNEWKIKTNIPQLELNGANIDFSPGVK